jgi:hypothetical protein
MNTISWRTPTSPMPMEINPRVVFDRMFGDGATADERRRRIETQRSILDAVTSQVRRLQGGLGAGDRNRVAEYLDTVREIERRIELAEKRTSENLEVPVSPRGIPDDFVEHTKLMFDLMTIAFQADITRISTFMMAREVSYRTFPMLGISEAFHPRRTIRTMPNDCPVDQDPDIPRRLVVVLVGEASGNARRRRQPARSLTAPVRRRDEQQQRAQSLAASDRRCGRGGWRDEGRTSSPLPGQHAHGEPAVDILNKAGIPQEVSATLQR